jgi:hypothetical protein
MSESVEASRTPKGLHGLYTDNFTFTGNRTSGIQPVARPCTDCDILLHPVPKLNMHTFTSLVLLHVLVFGHRRLYLYKKLKLHVHVQTTKHADIGDADMLRSLTNWLIISVVR